MRRRWRRTGVVFPPEAWARDGLAPLEVASRFGRLTLRRQMLVMGVGTAREAHATPGNAALPPQGGLVITRGLQELACLRPDTLPFVSAERLLGWQTQAAPAGEAAPAAKAVLCASTLRTVVREHGAALAKAEWREVTRLRATLARGEGAAGDLCPRLLPARTPRRRAGWPAALSAAVDQALAAGETRPPRGVRLAEWERVLAARRQERAEAGAEDLRRLGPEIGADEVVASADEVLTRRPQRRQFWELRTARVATAEGYRYVSGTGATVLATLGVRCALCQGAPAGAGRPPRHVVFVAAGARWLRDFYQATLAPRGATLILDWYHLHHRCYQVATQVCRPCDKPTRVRFLGALGRLLWRGDVDGAIAAAEEFRAAAKAPPDPRRPAPLDAWITYLEARRTSISCYRERHQQCQYIGSGQAEKANDLLVARRQKNKGMHWSEETSVALMRLRTLRLNGDWDRYWRQRQAPSLLAA